MESSKRKRYCYILTTEFASDSKKLVDWKANQDLIQSISWEKVFSGPSENIDNLGDDIHTVLDSLPQNGPHECLLDVLWFTDSVPRSKKIPPNLFGALKRAVEWHGATIFVMSSDSKPCSNKPMYLKELRAELIYSSDPDVTLSLLKKSLDPNLFWRGSMAFFDDSSMSFVHTDAKFELRYHSYILRKHFYSTKLDLTTQFFADFFLSKQKNLFFNITFWRNFQAVV